VSRTKRTFASLIAAGLSATAPAAFACGFENPNSISVTRGVLNLAYPNSLHVVSAVWSAQLDGQIARSELRAGAQPLLGYHQAVARLGAFRDRLSTAITGGDVPPFSVVLIGPMLWTNYRPIGTALDMTPHAGGPLSGDVVIVTDVPVIAALVEGRVTAQQARELGLMRLYGSAAAVQGVISWFDRMSSLGNLNRDTKDMATPTPARYAP
jgi:hypothetical protein